MLAVRNLEKKAASSSSPRATHGEEDRAEGFLARHVARILHRIDQAMNWSASRSRRRAIVFLASHDARLSASTSDVRSMGAGLRCARHDPIRATTSSAWRPHERRQAGRRSGRKGESQGGIDARRRRNSALKARSFFRHRNVTGSALRRRIRLQGRGGSANQRETTDPQTAKLSRSRSHGRDRSHADQPESGKIIRMDSSTIRESGRRRAGRAVAVAGTGRQSRRSRGDCAVAEDATAR